MVLLLLLYLTEIYPDGVTPGGMGHLALQRVWHSPHSAGESPFSAKPSGEGNKRASEPSQSMRLNREHMTRA